MATYLLGNLIYEDDTLTRIISIVTNGIFRQDDVRSLYEATMSISKTL